jgi:hypothetical protein
MNYFAYGSNLHTPHLRSWLVRCGVDPQELGPGWRATLDGYRLRTNYLCSHGAGAANIEPAPRRTVEGVIMTITPAVHRVLRAKEGFPHRYTEIEVAVVPCGKRQAVNAMTYVVIPEWCLPFDVPVTVWYRQLILEGAASHGLSPAYQRYLRRLLRVRRIEPVATVRLRYGG